MKSTLDIKDIVKIGGSVIINSSISTLNIKDIVKVASTSSQIIIKKADNMSTLDIKDIVKVAGGKTVIFDFTE
ncbi:hypothetical protein PJV89_05285 [Aliarcobacter butzleri]|uniref:hypothetical protein n=1 Tax=Aliarcobacter butzleri TaxID=28197 RepID=UPI00263C95CA|nr:hypothetical protein [Aliarcobacter butzleri]MDN5077644.1 hypothetical protein [Aliarcobacter butzleri]MDN5118808.1 hypothetical protein [Aliarcobacter butzleri]